MKTDANTYRYRGFLPNYFIKIGIGVIIFFVAFFISGMIFEDSITISKEIIASIGLDGIILGLLLISLSKSRIEDEMILVIRLRAFTKAFVGGAVYVISSSITSLLTKNELPINPYSLIIVELVFFICLFEIAKRKLNKL